MATDDRFNVLIIDPDSASRGKLKQVALALTTFKKVHTISNLREGLAMTSPHESIDIVCLSYRFEEKDIGKFIETAKATEGGKEWAYMAVLKSAEQKNQVVANGVITGIDGFLFEPYSADNMREMAEITAKVKHRNAMNRKKAAMKMILKEVIEHIDAVSFYKSKGKDPITAKKRLAESCQSLRKFRGEVFDVYVEMAIELFGAAQPPAVASYSGVSKRIKDRLETKMLKDLEERYK